MPWWVMLYFAGYCILAVVGLWDDYCERRPAWFLIIAVNSNLVIGYLFIAYWYRSLQAGLGPAARFVFVAAVCWEVYQAVEDLRSLQLDPDNQTTDGRRLVLIASIATVVTCLPVVVVAGMVTFWD